MALLRLFHVVRFTAISVRVLGRGYGMCEQSEGDVTTLTDWRGGATKVVPQDPPYKKIVALCIW
jgi:hypothetical protein